MTCSSTSGDLVNHVPVIRPDIYGPIALYWSFARLRAEFTNSQQENDNLSFENGINRCVESPSGADYAMLRRGIVTK
jgi:hypothetical protein